jgi:hypothetical protein
MQRHMVETEFWVGDTVYRKMDRDNTRGMVLEVNIMSIGHTYRCTFGEGFDATCYELELCGEPAWGPDDKYLFDPPEGDDHED